MEWLLQSEKSNQCGETVFEGVNEAAPDPELLIDGVTEARGELLREMDETGELLIETEELFETEAIGVVEANGEARYRC